MQKTFNRLESMRLSLAQELGSMEYASFTQPELPGKWSLAQVVAHLIQAEDSSLMYVQKKMQGLHHLPKAGWGARFRLWLLYLSQVLPLKFKAPAVVAQPPGNETPSDIFLRWEKSRAGLRQLLETFPDGEKTRLIYRHPLAGRFTLQQCLLFFEYHIQHHLRQVRRVKGVVAKK